MKNKIIEKLEETFKLTSDLLASLKDLQLEKQIPNVKSNKIGEQFWCIVGARESYIKSLINSKWIGFSCSIKNRFSNEEILKKLDKTLQDLKYFLQENPSLNETQENLILDLLSHETQHHGQLIRFFYALEIPFPKSWNKKYTV